MLFCTTVINRMKERNDNYSAPRTKFLVLDPKAVLCGSGEKFNPPQGVGIGSYDNITNSDDNDF